MIQWWKEHQFRRHCKNPTVSFEHWDKFGVRAGFTTRHFPLLLRRSHELELLHHQEDVRRNFAVSTGIDPSTERFVYTDQIHEVKVAVVDNESLWAGRNFVKLELSDGILTPLERVTLIVLTADCLPVYFHAAGTQGRPAWIGLVHAGWRGAYKGIAEKAFRMIMEKAGCRPSDVHIAFGPSISRDQYEVGPEFRNYFPSSAFHSEKKKLYFDLAGENRRQLLKAGALRSHLFAPKLCTASQNQDLYSFRQEKDHAGRMLSFITKVVK